MKKFIIRISYSVLMLLILLIGLFFFCLSSTPGLYTMIRLSALFIPGTLKVDHLSGRLLDTFSIDEINYENKQIKVKIKHLTVNWQFRSLLHSQLIINSLTADTTEINQDNSIIDLKKIKLSGQLNKQNLQLNSLQFNYSDQLISSKLLVDTKPPYTLSGKIKLNPHPASQEMLNGVLNIGGDLNQLQWTGDFQGPAELSLKGNFKNLSELNLTSKWRNFKLQKSGESKFNSPEGRIIISGTLPHLNIVMTSKINNSPQENWQLAANIQGTVPLQWSFDANLSQSIDSSAKHEGLYTSLTAKGAIKDSNHGNVVFTVNPGHYQMPADTLLPPLKFQGGTLNVLLSPHQLSGNGSLAIDENKKLNILFKLPKFDISRGISSNQPISAEFSLILNSFDFLKDISPDLVNPKGRLIASLKAAGTVGKTILESKLSLSQASLDIPKLGLNLNAIDLTAFSKKQHWEAIGSLVSSGKKLALTGKGPLDSKLNGELSLQGSDFPIMNTNEYQINVSPQLKLNFTSSALNITGSVLIPFAQIKPQTFSSSITLSDDVIFKTQNDANPPSPFKTSMDLRVEMGNEVELTVKGLHATLGGVVNLKQLPDGPVSATGELSVKKGEYKAYGQDLAIEQGQLIFTGGRLDNPGINVRAAKKIDTTTTSATGANQSFDFNNNNLQNANARGNISVGVEVTGRLSEPKILLFSNPSILSQADILSMLVLGRPASQANKAGGQLLLAAISSMNLGNGTNGTQLLEQLKKNLGFDFNVQTTSNYNLVTNQISDNTALVVGKSLSKRIYVSYNVGLSPKDPNVLTLKYLLNKFYSIQVSSTTTSSGIDILYTSSK